jgi:uncharacterized cupredoxin-like copper-binding protein
MRRSPRTDNVLRIIPLALAALLLATCTPTPDPAPPGSQVVVELSDYTVTLSVPSIKAGSVKIGVRNLAGMAHDFVAIKTDLAPDKLPLDGASGKAKEDGKVARIDTIPGGKAASVTVDLVPGRYVLICNIPAHYQLGMHAGFTVEP